MTTVTTYKGKEYTEQDISAMREWIANCQWPDLDQDEIAELSPHFCKQTITAPNNPIINSNNPFNYEPEY